MCDCDSSSRHFWYMLKAYQDGNRLADAHRSAHSCPTINRVLAALEPHTHFEVRDVALVIAHTGISLSEVIALECRDLDISARHWWSAQATPGPLKVLASGAVVDRLIARTRDRTDTEKIFQRPYYWLIYGLNRALKMASAKTRLPVLGAHDLRLGCACRNAGAYPRSSSETVVGISPLRVSRLLSHVV